MQVSEQSLLYQSGSQRRLTRAWNQNEKLQVPCKLPQIHVRRASMAKEGVTGPYQVALPAPGNSNRPPLNLLSFHYRADSGFLAATLGLAVFASTTEILQWI